MGVVFYEMANGLPPFTEGDLSYQHLFVEPKPIKNVAAEFNKIVLKCLVKEREDRWQDASEILKAMGSLKLDDTA